jgi:hypothetical protein
MKSSQNAVIPVKQIKWADAQETNSQNKTCP